MQPRGDLTTRTLTMPADANPSGDIFGGWVLSQMDIAGGIHAGQHAKRRVATVAIEAMHFIKPVHVGDVLCVYAAVERVGRTSVAIRLEAAQPTGRSGQGDRGHLYLRRTRRRGAAGDDRAGPARGS